MAQSPVFSLQGHPAFTSSAHHLYPCASPLPPSDEVSHRKGHRRTDTATLIAHAAKPFLTPKRILSFIVVVCAASCLSKQLMLLTGEPIVDQRATPSPLAALNGSAPRPLAPRPSSSKPRVARKAAQRPNRLDRAQRPSGRADFEPFPLGRLFEHHDQKLAIKVVDGQEQHRLDEAAARHRIEDALQGGSETSSMEQILLDLAENEEEEGLDSELQEDENEDVHPLELVKAASQVHLPVRMVRSRPVSEFLWRMQQEETEVARA